MLPMKKLSCMILGGALAAALALTACGGTNAGSGGNSSGMSESMGGAQSSQSGGNAAWRTGLGILTEASASGDTSKVNTITGKTPDEVRDIKTDEDGKPADADLLSGCTIAVDGYRDAVLRACENAKAAG